MKYREFLKVSVGALLATFFLWMVARHIAWQEVKTALVSARWAWIALALLAFSAGYACRIARWQAMLKLSNPDIQWSHCAGPLLGSFAANNVLPFRAGDVLRAFAFNRELGVTTPAILSTLLAERLLDLLMVLAVLGLSLHAFAIDIAQLAGVGATGLLVGATLIVVVLLRPGLFRPVAALCLTQTGKLSPKLQAKVSPPIAQIFDTLESLAEGSLMMRLISWSCAAWLFEGLVFWCTAMALPGMVHPAAAWLALPVGTLATLIPSTPGYVGTFDFFTIRAMTLTGNPLAEATAFALLVHIVLWMPTTLIGGLYMLLRSTSTTQQTQA